MLLATPTLSDAATITAGSEALSATHLQTQQPTTVWRASDLDNAYIEVDLGSPYAIDFIGLLFSNATVDATWRVRAASTQGNLTSSPAYDSGGMVFHAGQEALTLVWGSPQDDPTRTAYERTHALHTPSEQTLRWWRIDINDPQNPDGYIDVGRLYISDSFVPERTIRYGFGVQWRDGQVRQQSLGNNTFPQARGRYRRWVGNIRWSNESDVYDELFRLQRKRGTSGDVLVMADTDRREMDWTVYGLLTDIEPITYVTYGMYEANLTVQELI